MYRLRRNDSVAGYAAGPARNRLLKARATVGLGLVLAQLVLVLIVHASTCCQERYFAWAPNDYSIDYRISATVDGRALTSSEILERYRLPQVGFYEDPPERLADLLRRRELAYGVNDRVEIVLEYELDGREPTQWRWSNG